MQIEMKQPGTVYIHFLHEQPKKFVLTNERGNVYYFRYLTNSVPRIKINIVHPGLYRGNVPFKIVKIVPLEIPQNLPELPEPERNRFKPFNIVDNFSLQGTPARIFTHEGIIEKSREFYELPEPLRLFILLHEVGHFYYGVTEKDKAYAASIPDGEQWLKNKRDESEKKCDLFALVHYLKMGYNRSMAFYALSHVLKKSKANEQRLKSLLDNIQKTQNNALT
jgi:hypothetical protein